jgi:hypothetical protein
MDNSIVVRKKASPAPTEKVDPAFAALLSGQIPIIVDISVDNISLDTCRNIG